MNNEGQQKESAAHAPEPRRREEKSAPPVQKGSMSVFLYILLLFSAALLLMGLSSMIHQRNNTEALGKLQSSVSVMQEVQNLQEKIIGLQESRETLEGQLEQARSDAVSAAAQAEEQRRRVEALERLYLMRMQYQAGRYQSCQESIEAFETDGLAKSLPSDAPESGIISPLDCYRQLQDATAARIAEALSAPPVTEDAPEGAEE